VAYGSTLDCSKVEFYIKNNRFFIVIFFSFVDEDQLFPPSVYAMTQRIFKFVTLFSFPEEDQLFPPSVYSLATSENSRDRDLVEAFINHRIQVLIILRFYTCLNDHLGLQYKYKSSCNQFFP
jgi:hypothetical protein